MSQLTLAAAGARTDDLRAVAARQRRAVPATPAVTEAAAITIRRATAADRPVLERLAALDSARVPAGDVLIGETAGEPVAAVAIADGTVVADPFRPTADLVAVVAARAAMLRGAVPARPRRGVRRPAFAA
jgi:hypothetical protein